MAHALSGCLERCGRVALLAALALLAHVAAAWAHASLSAADPPDGAVVEAAPQRYSLTFSEPVSPLSLVLVRPDGSSAPLDRFSVRDRIVEVEAPAGLERGTHVLSWRVVSQDGHPIGGLVFFSIGEASAEPPLVEEFVDGTVVEGVRFTKVALYVGLFAGVGGAFARRILMPDIGAGARAVVAALVLGAAGAVLSVGFQGLDALGAQAGRIAEPVVWSTGFGTTHGRTVIAALAAFVLAGSAFVLTGFPAQAAACAALLLAGASLALSGHASAAAPQWLMRPAVFLHAVAIAAWIGALAPLGLALKRGEPGAQKALRRFSRAVPAVVAVLAVSGAAQAVVQVGHPRAMLDTAYGQVFLVKLALLAGLFALAGVNRWLLTARVEAGDPVATRRQARMVAAETLVVLLIFAAAASWRFTPPPRVLAAAAAEPATEYIHTDRALAYIWVLPGRAGAVDVSVNVLTGDFELLDAREVAVVFSNPNAGVAPFSHPLTRRGEANWRAEGLTIPQAGLWRVRVDVLIDDVESARLEGQIRIRP